jgi:hypothetical protein
MLWSLLPNALLPIPLSTTAAFLDRFVAHLLRANGRVRPRQIDRLRQLFAPPLSGG